MDTYKKTMLAIGILSLSVQAQDYQKKDVLPNVKNYIIENIIKPSGLNEKTTIIKKLAGCPFMYANTTKENGKDCIFISKKIEDILKEEKSLFNDIYKKNNKIIKITHNDWKNIAQYTLFHECGHIIHKDQQNLAKKHNKLFERWNKLVKRLKNINKEIEDKKRKTKYLKCLKFLSNAIQPIARPIISYTKSFITYICPNSKDILDRFFTFRTPTILEKLEEEKERITTELNELIQAIVKATEECVEQELSADKFAISKLTSKEEIESVIKFYESLSTEKKKNNSKQNILEYYRSHRHPSNTKRIQLLQNKLTSLTN